MKTIVTTTINPPTIATLKFAEKKDWNFIIVGDLKTPHHLYHNLEETYPNVHYLSPEYQEKYKKLSDIIGWNSIQRRNIGFIEAYHKGSSIIASVDDDNIPYDNWGKKVYVGQEISLPCWTVKSKENEFSVFDPLSVTGNEHLWHRGFPVEYLQIKNDVTFLKKTTRKVLIQADLWDGHPDIDALCRLIYNPIVDFNSVFSPYCSDSISPFNSQNTFFAREVIPYYAVLPHVGRMDDIWGGYMLQQIFKDNLIYGPASVYQERNAHNTIKDLEQEIIGYKYTLDFIKNNCNMLAEYIPDKTRLFYQIYLEYFYKEEHNGGF